jgi:exodeoxyribonuclease VII small subunit
MAKSASVPGASASATSAKAPGFDDILTKLRESVEKLESGELSLEQSLTVYEQGVGLARDGQQLLDNAQKRVDLLISRSSADLTTAPSSVPFDE